MRGLVRVCCRSCLLPTEQYRQTGTSASSSSSTSISSSVHSNHCTMRAHHHPPPLSPKPPQLQPFYSHHFHTISTAITTTTTSTTHPFALIHCVLFAGTQQWTTAPHPPPTTSPRDSSVHHSTHALFKCNHLHTEV